MEEFMMHMYKVINTSDIPDTSTIAIEYQIPLTSKRIDFIISGVDDNQRSNIVIIELNNGNRQNYLKIRNYTDTLPTR